MNLNLEYLVPQFVFRTYRTVLVIVLATKYKRHLKQDFFVARYLYLNMLGVKYNCGYKVPTS
jgi:hypothetical protein